MLAPATNRHERGAVSVKQITLHACGGAHDGERASAPSDTLKRLAQPHLP
jgi:hypothetical protein